MRNGIPVAVVRATEQLRKYRYGLKIMAGGFTISGGEPLMQDRFVVKMFRAAKEMGIHTALDTNGYYGERLTDPELDLVDVVLLDLKAWDEQKHKHLTGREPGPTRDFAKRLAVRRRPVWVRYVLVPGLSDDPAEVQQVARFAGALGNVERVDVLPFHQMGRFKWGKLGIPYKLDATTPPTPESVENACAAFRAEGLMTY